MKRLITLGLLVFPTFAWAQAQQPPPNHRPNSNSNSPLLWSVDLIINNYVRTLGASYKLSPEQEEYTRNLTAQRVKRFLVDYEKDVRWMATEMLDYKMKGQLPPPEIAKVWGERAKQMMPAIRAEIMEGNNKWREILNDDQKHQHDRDLQALDKQFDNWTQMASRWADGTISPKDFDAPGQLSPHPRTVRPSEEAWEFYVRSFIQMYNLDESQQQTANSVLRESREQATQYREAHKAEFSQLDAADQAVTQSSVKTDPDELKKAQEQTRERLNRRRNLEKPISGIFERLKTRLLELPTTEQRRAYEQRYAKLEKLGKRGTTKPALSTADSQPTTAADASKDQ